MLLRKFFKRLFAFILIIFLSGAAAIVAGWFYWQDWMQKPLPVPSEGIYITLEKGLTLGHALNELSQKHILDYPKPLRWYAQFKQQTKVHVGEYFLEQGITPEKLLEKFNKGAVVLYHITFVEGWTIKQVLAVLAAKDKIKQDSQHFSHEDIARKLGIENGQLEGWIFPDTYTFSRNTPDLDLLQQDYQRMHQVFN